MKVEELCQQENYSQVGVSFQRIPFETEIDIFPQLNPLIEAVVNRSSNSNSMMSDLTSSQTEERLERVLKHQEDGDEDLPAIPLRRIDSGAHQHQIQGFEGGSEASAKLSEGNDKVRGPGHYNLLEEIDNDTAKGCDRAKTPKKESTLSRMLKGMRGDKDGGEECTEKVTNNMSLSKLFQRINPVGKTSRDNVSKVFHRIGDALQKKTEEDRCGSAGKAKTLGRNGKNKEQDVQNVGAIGEKMFRCRTADAQVDKAP